MSLSVPSPSSSPEPAADQKPELRILEISDDQPEMGLLTKEALLRIEALRDSGALRESLVDPALREKFDQWEASGDY